LDAQCGWGYSWKYLYGTRPVCEKCYPKDKLTVEECERRAEYWNSSPTECMSKVYSQLASARRENERLHRAIFSYFSIVGSHEGVLFLSDGYYSKPDDVPQEDWDYLNELNECGKQRYKDSNNG